MRKYLFSFGILISAFLGGAFAQSMGGGAIQRAIAAVQGSFSSIIIHQAVNYGVGSVSGPNNAFIWSSDPALSDNPGSNTATGVCTDTNYCTPNLFVVGRDTVDASAASNGYYGFTFANNTGGTGTRSSHHAMLVSQTVVAAPDDEGASRFYTALNPNFVATANATGSGGAYRGDGFSMNPQCTLGNGATFWNSCVGMEIDVQATTGSSVHHKIGQQIVQLSTDAVSGDRSNIGLSFNSASGVTGWTCGICFGSYAGFNPMASTGTLIGTFNNGGSIGGGSMGTVVNGVDFRQYTFTGTPFGAPLITPASSSAACVTGGIVWDASNIYICTTTNTWKKAALSTF